MKQPRLMKSSEGRHAAIEYAPRIAELTLQYRRLNSREARVAFIDTWLRTWAYNFEKTWPVIYQALEWVEKEELYKDPRVMSPDEIYPDFKSFFEARLKKPFTLWMELEQTHHYVSKYAPELIDQTWGDARAKAAAHYQEINATAPNLKDIGRPKNSDNNVGNKVNVTNIIRPSNDAEYAIRRLRKDRPDIHQRVLDGEISAHAGMVEAGFRKKRERKKLSAFERIVKLLPKLTDDEREKLREMVRR